jgi:8-oxo-dGTP diphosphatase
MPYTPIVATLGYVLSPDRSRVLLVHRCRRPEDAHLGKYNGLGGKLEREEDVAACMRREVLEESGVEVTEMRLRGTVSWPGFGTGGEDWLGFLFLITRFTGEPRREGPDGPLEWVEVSRLHEVPMWEGDRHFLPLVFGPGPQFHGVMPYRHGKPVGWSYTLLGD